MFCNISTLHIAQWLYGLVFPTGQDSATFRDKGTEVPSLSQDKGTAGQAQNLTKGRDGPGQHVKIQDGTRDGTVLVLFNGDQKTALSG